ncbi:GH39 family glycosyl hydrolase [Caldimonas tepidiphila]|uniref:GH39 family glycosyl hydrolase n=1 Tax=Caldimonas tepidiphila TaxID=2315841 RepID=UPI0013005EBF|nr:glycosyl hydrolase [Caldimonas tepidiphila]
MSRWSALRCGRALLLGLALLAGIARPAAALVELPASSGAAAGGGRERAMAAARPLELPGPRINAWGQPAPRHEFETLRAEGGSTPRHRLRIVERARGSDAHLFWPLPFRKGRAYQAELTLSAAAPVDVEVMLRRDEPPWDPYAIRTLRLGRTPQTVRLEGWALSDAPASLRVAVLGEGVDVFAGRPAVRETPGGAFGPALTQPVPDAFFGVHLMRLGQHLNWPDFDPGFVRLWDTRTTWKDLQPEPGGWNFGNAAWRRLDLYVNHVRRVGRAAQPLLVLGQTPRWASTEPDSHSPYGRGHAAPPRDTEDWRRYVRTLARRYAGRIRHWELWNEPDHSIFYRGSVERMVELARVAREELKAADPANVLVSPGLTMGQGLRWLHRFLAAGGGRHVDVIAFHWYYDSAPESLLPAIANVRQLMRQHGVADKPLWNTEGGLVCNKRLRDCSPMRLGEDEQLGLHARAMLLMWSAGVARFDYYFWEGRWPGEALLEGDFRTPTLAGRGRAEAVRWMRGARVLDAFHVGERVWVLRMQRGERRFSIVWATEPTEVRLPREWGSTRLRRLDGRAARLEGGRVVVTEAPMLLQ